MKKRFVLSGYFGFKNFGDEAILSVLVKKLQADGHRITIISSDPQYTKKQFKHIEVFTRLNFKILLEQLQNLMFLFLEVEAFYKMQQV